MKCFIESISWPESHSLLEDCSVLTGSRFLTVFYRFLAFFKKKENKHKSYLVQCPNAKPNFHFWHQQIGLNTLYCAIVSSLIKTGVLSCHISTDVSSSRPIDDGSRDLGQVYWNPLSCYSNSSGNLIFLKSSLSSDKLNCFAEKSSTDITQQG